MADILLPTTAKPSTGASFAKGLAGATLTQGVIVCRDTAKKFQKASAAAFSTTAVAVGMATQSATSDTPMDVQTEGLVIGLSGLTPGVFYYLSDTVAGDICLYADLGAGASITQIGYAISATELQLNIINTGETI